MLEKIRELVILLQTGIEDYEVQLKTLQEERLKYIRLSRTNGFGTDENSSRESWLLHLKQLEDSLELRVNALNQAIKETAADIASRGDGDTTNTKERHDSKTGDGNNLESMPIPTNTKTFN